MRKWAFFIAAAIAVIGCGGGGSSRSNNNGNPTTGTPGSNLSVNLNQNFGTVQFTYLTGQGRAPGDLVAVVRRLELQDEFGLVRTDLETPHRLPLSEYVLDVVRLNVPFTGQSGRIFPNFRLEFVGFEVEDPDNSGTGANVEAEPPAAETFPARVRVVPGRETSLPIFLDDSMFHYNQETDALGNVTRRYITFDRDSFTLRNNLSNPGDMVRTFFSDYVAFDLSAMPAAERPTLSNGQAAQRVFLSGDNYAIGSDVGSRRFEVLTLETAEPIVGTYGDEGVLGGRQTPGTYTLRQPNPTDLEGLLQITSLAGIWRDSTRAFSNFGEFEFILFPTSRDEPADETNGNGLKPDEDQELAIVRRNAAGQIIGFYFGYADLDTGKFTAYPISQLANAGTEGEVEGTLSNYMNAGGGGTVSYDLVRRGTFTFGAGAPAGFPTTGTFVVYRK